jgi:hypothetical protein
MSMAAVADAGWWFHRDLSAVPGFGGQGIAGAFTTGRARAAAPQGADSAAVDADAGSGSSSSTLAQNVQVFMLAFYEALSNTAAQPVQQGSASTAHTPANNSSVYYYPPTYSRASVATSRASGYQQGSKGLLAKLQALIAALSDTADTGAENNVSSLQAAFNRLMQDLETSGASLASDGRSGGGSGLSLRSWLLGLQQNLQQPGANTLSPLGNLIDVMV